MPLRILMAAAILGAAGMAVQASEARRVWTDPPRETAEPAAERAPEAGPLTVAPAAWPDEAQRRRPPDPPLSAPARAADRAGPMHEGRTERGTEYAEEVQTAQPLPAVGATPTISRRTKRRLGLLAGFAGAPAVPDTNAAPVASSGEVSGRQAQQAQRALGRIRVLQLRRGRVVVVYTRS